MAISCIFGTSSGAIAAAGFLFGGLWLSPDLDTRSRSLQRWGPLGWLWWPYRRLIPHRSLWSHGPLIGTASRLLLLLTWTLLLSLLVPGLQAIDLWNVLEQTHNHAPQQLLALVMGLEASTWLHLIQDGDPWPVEWTRRRQR